MFGKNGLLHSINRKIDKISLNMEKFKLVDYVYYLEHPRKMLLGNFMGGVARGVGIGIGFTLVTALVLYILQIVVKWNLPLIGKFIKTIIDIIKENMQAPGGKING